MGFFLVFGGVAAAIGGIYAAMRAAERRRAGEVRALATALGWDFQPLPAVPPAIRQAEPFSSGHSHRCRNRLVDHEGFAAFDLHYTVGHGKHSSIHRQTVAEFWIPSGRPPFALCMENFVHRIAQLFGMQDIDLPEHGEFSRRYLLRGPDAASIRAFFTPTVVDFFETHPGLCATCTGEHLYLYRPGRLAPAAEFGTLLATSKELQRRLRSAAGSPAPT